jgi:hypothetical protein
MQPDAATQNKQVHLADDILRGAEAIAEFLFLGASEDQRDRNRRKIYYLAESSRLPIFRLGSMLCARKSVLLDFIAAQEIRVLEEYGIAGDEQPGSGVCSRAGCRNDGQCPSSSDEALRHVCHNCR